MPIPKPTTAETEQEFVSRCISEIYDEYGQEQSAAICYNTYRMEMSKQTTQQRAFKKISELSKGINLAEDSEQGSCWEGYVQVGMKEKDGVMVPNCVPADSINQ